ncbi:MAG: nickel pincer cofactor biosynthesis protein LarB [Candidatus Omnitrophota bacterium]
MRDKFSYVQVGVAKIDIQRPRRCGIEEAIYAPGKTVSQLEKTCKFFFRFRKPLILTRLEQAVYQKLKKTNPYLKYSSLARIAFFLPEAAKKKRKIKSFVLVISAGISDAPVAEEVFVTLKVLGLRTQKLYDVGVAGINRLLAHKRLLNRASCIVVVAGMDAALTGVVAGLVKAPVIAVPTSCGYGAHFRGLSSLLTMLNSCAAGVAVVNIDNGFGAAVLAYKILNQFGK